MVLLELEKSLDEGIEVVVLFIGSLSLVVADEVFELFEIGS